MHEHLVRIITKKLKYAIIRFTRDTRYYYDTYETRMTKYFNRRDQITTKINGERTLTLFTFEETARRGASRTRHT